MNKYIYAFKDLLLDAYSVPRFEEKDPEQYATGLKRAILKGFSTDQLAQFADQELYCLGTYNDDKATFELLPEPRRILECNVVLKFRKDEETKNEEDVKND